MIALNLKKDNIYMIITITFECENECVTFLRMSRIWRSHQSFLQNLSIEKFTSLNAFEGKEVDRR
ncbi:unnamed protein product [Larinioides sclopetarius]|uniref:Uncharacterized protein n=1 Tax=Larinioides sclopetarius TaxID=280406 RepID=A0AAV2A3A9_9ARAC